jgi:PAS domain S-box-containing protein
VGWLALLLLATIVLVPMFARAYLQQIWTGIALYGGGGLALIAVPWLGPALERIDPRSLRTRLAVTLGISSALALILLVTVDTTREEGSLRAQALASQRTLANALGHDAADYVELHEAAVRALAGDPLLFDRPLDEQVARLQGVGAAYPNVVVFSIFDAEGQQLARSDGRPLVSAVGTLWFARIQETRTTVRIVARSTSIGRAIFAYALPIVRPDGTLSGVVSTTVESSKLAEQLRQVVADPAQRAYLFDSQGRTIAHPDDALTASFADLRALTPVAALLDGRESAGSLVYTAEREEWLAGYARVPELGWGVVVEQPTGVALAGVRAGRERAFVVLIVVVGLAAGIGVIVAGWLTRPLAVLSLAVQRLADGDGNARLGASGLTEVARLASAFSEMRERLTARTLEHERSEAALRLSEERLRLALEAGRMGTWDWNVQTNELSWDGSLEEIHGLAPGTFDGRFETFVGLLHADDRERALATIQAALQEGDQFSIESRVIWADGSVHWIAGLGRAYLDAYGQPIRMVGIGLEVTERRRAAEVQRVLAEAGSRLVSSLDYETTLRSIAQLVVTTMADYCIVEVRAEDGAGSVEVAHADPSLADRARRLLGEPGADASSNGWPPDDGETARSDGWNDRSVLLPTIAANDDGLVSLPLIGHNPGLTRIARLLGGRSLISVPLLARDRTIGVLTLIAAESGRRYGQEDLAMAEALAIRAALAVDNARLYADAQAAIRARDEFLSIASHELRTPVAGIKGYAQLLLRAQARNRLEPARLTRSLSLIDEATDRLTTLTQDLLDVSRIRLGQLPLRLQEINLEELVRRIGLRTSEQLPDGHALVVDVQGAVPPIQADADRLEQVLTNLLDNAVKYSPDGGTVRLTLGVEGDEVVLAVHDDGIGLPLDAAEAIFHPFGRAPNATSRNLPGMGLGLYICRNIVERHGGRIVARSAGEGHGTTFEVALPSQSVAESPPAPSEALPA